VTFTVVLDPSGLVMPMVTVLPGGVSVASTVATSLGADTVTTDAVEPSQASNATISSQAAAAARVDAAPIGLVGRYARVTT
jgi:hypothetical protein